MKKLICGGLLALAVGLAMAPVAGANPNHSRRVGNGRRYRSRHPDSRNTLPGVGSLSVGGPG